MQNQPPSGGCVLKLSGNNRCIYATFQPPSGGCVLKPGGAGGESQAVQPAAFRRLCVETASMVNSPSLLLNQPPSGGCVLKRASAEYQTS